MTDFMSAVNNVDYLMFDSVQDERLVIQTPYWQGTRLIPAGSTKPCSYFKEMASRDKRASKEDGEGNHYYYAKWIKKKC